MGEEHPNYATALNNLAAGLEQEGLHAEARKHLKRALKINKKALGDEHQSTRDTASNLGRLAEKGKKKNTATSPSTGSSADRSS